MNSIRSSRKLEREINRNIELMWLLKGLTPDFKTIADFRKDNKKAIKNVFKEFTLLSKELIAVDGSKFKAWNGKKKNFNTRKLKRKLKEIYQKIDEYIELLDVSDDDDDNKPGNSNINPDKIKKKVKKLNEKKEQYEKYQQIIKENDTTQVSLTDPEARSMVNN